MKTAYVISLDKNVVMRNKLAGIFLQMQLVTGYLKFYYHCYVQPAAQSKVSCGPVMVSAVAKVSQILTTCPF